MKAINAIFAWMLSVSLPTFAESNFNPSINIDLQTRVSYLNDRIDNHIRHDASGFKGDYFLLSVSGQVTDRLTYSWRQRINQKKERSDRFDGTDLSVLPGTEMVAYGGGVEFFPTKGKPDVRVSLGVSHSTGTNSNPSGTLNDNQTTVRLSFIAKLHLLSWKNK